MQADIDQLNAEITSLSDSISECDQNVAERHRCVDTVWRVMTPESPGWDPNPDD